VRSVDALVERARALQQTAARHCTIAWAVVRSVGVGNGGTVTVGPPPGTVLGGNVEGCAGEVGLPVGLPPGPEVGRAVGPAVGPEDGWVVCPWRLPVGWCRVVPVPVAVAGAARGGRGAPRCSPAVGGQERIRWLVVPFGTEL
jgi:hypothetical protein